MRSPRSILVLPFVVLLLSACNGGKDDDAEETAEPSTPKRGDLIDGAPAKRATVTPEQLVALLDTNELTEALAAEILTPQCSVDIHQLKYQTVDPAGNITPASGALMVPTGSGSSCQGQRPILLYAHGTATDKAFNLANVQDPDNGEGLAVAAVFAADGYIVVAPNYLGYDTSTLPYHPYLNGDQQSKDMIDALTAARSALPTSSAPNTTAGGKLFITGYSQGGYVAMATHRALQAANETVTASGPMSGPYALSAFGDAIFSGQVTQGAPVNLTLLISSYQRAYGNIYTNATDAFEPKYATGIDTLLPSTTPVGELKSQGKLPQDALFDSTPPDPSFASLTPATTPADLASIFAAGFGADPLLTNGFRLAYLQDAQNHPDGGFPAVSDGLPPASPANALRQALKTNDQRNWTPAAPMLLCAGSSDPTVLYLNTQLMQNYWSSTTTVTVLDIDSAIASGDPYEAQKRAFAVAKDVLRLSDGESGMLDQYHVSLVAPFCLSAVKSFFDAH